MQLHALWAKIGDGCYPDFYHPVACHLSDVAAVALQLLEDVIHPALRRRLASWLGLPEDAVCRWLAFWIGAHDIGKISPCFQDQDRSQKARLALTAEGFTFDYLKNVPHGVLSAAILRRLLAEPFQWPAIHARLARRIAVAVGGHHGTFNSANSDEALGDEKWWQARRESLLALAREVGILELAPPQVTDCDHAFFLFLAGLTSVADWIGSNRQFFEFAIPKIKLSTYSAHATIQAQKALLELGWLGWKSERSPRSFRNLFPAIVNPRRLQTLVEASAARFDSPRLALIEAPMGEGKTEAALFLADHWIHAHEHQGLYFALPTQATSNQMFGRIVDFLARRYPEDCVNAQLLHGQALLSERFEKLRRAADQRRQSVRCGDIRETDDHSDAVVAEAWFAQNKKHGLLAPFAVGTIDQSLLAVLQTKHFFVGLFGLAGKVVVLDEVHAYDAYMSVLLVRLVEWLAALGCPVVLLSATLPAEKRRRLLEAYRGPAAPLPTDCPYPRVALVGTGPDAMAEFLHIEADPARARTIALEWHYYDRLADDLGAALKDGGCAAIVCNTVGRAQMVYETLRDRFASPDFEVKLFHARFLIGRRLEIEEDVLSRYGPPEKGAKRPARSVLVATQVVEQSLDLDFDLLVTEVAPVDLVLQRAGRLWRHLRKDPRGSITRPSVWLLRPEADENHVPAFGWSEKIYARFILLRSYLALRESAVAIELPGDIENLIEKVYGTVPLAVPEEDAWQVAMTEAKKEMNLKKKEAEMAAGTFLVTSPRAEDDILLDFSQQLDEDDPDLPKDRQAFTRLAEPSVTLVVLYNNGGRLSLDPEGQLRVNLARKPTLDDARAFLRNSVTIQRKGCVRHYARQKPPTTWKENGLLRFHRVVFVASDGMAIREKDQYPLRVDSEFGVRFLDVQKR